MQEKWMVELKGEEIDLQELDKFSSPPELEIKKEDKTYYLVSKEFEPSEEARIIVDIGKEIINIINGIAQLKFSNWKKINAGQAVFIDSHGKRHSYLLCETGYFRLRGGEVELKHIKADGTVISSNKANVKNQFFDIANRDIKVKKALRIYGSRDHNWHNLYNIYEVIEEDVGGKKEIVAKGWTTNKKIANFKHTACSEKVLGDEARHGSSNNNPPQKVVLLSEAQDFILSLMKNWLQTK